MRFDDSKSIFLQIVSYIEEMILSGKYREDERIPSVRELAAAMEVNPNTVIRSFSQLQESGIIYNRRGLGYFVSLGASDLIRERRREDFLSRELPRLFHAMNMLGIEFNELQRRFTDFTQGGYGYNENK